MTQSANQLLKSMTQAKALVVGDIMLDRFVYGEVNRISPEAPVPVLAAKRENRMLGGAGNVVANLRGLGVQTHLLGLIGAEQEGQLVRQMLKDVGADDSGLVVAHDRPTIIKMRFIAGSQQLLRTDYEEIKPLTADLESALLTKAEKLIQDCGVLVLSDYGKGVLNGALVGKLIALAKAHKKPVLVDPKGKDYSRYRGASLVTPNKKELSEAAGFDVKGDDAIVQAAQTLMKDHGIEAILATRAEEGMTIVQASGATHIRSKAVEVFDVSGAGDTVVATMAGALASGASLEDAANLANTAGGIVVTRVGTAAIKVDDFAAAKTADTAQDTTRQAFVFKDLNEAIAQVQRWKDKGLKVGFTNGCFDILHAGHVNYMNSARVQCDKLVVGINYDVSVRLLKGPTRPVNDEMARATVLGGLGSVDMVVFFGAAKTGEDNTASPLVSALKPDVYFKGADYTIDRIPEAKIVQSYGGEVFLVPLTEGHSTTSTIAKIGADKDPGKAA